MLAVLALAGSSALGLSLPIALAIVVLMVAVGSSYRQLIRAYPNGGGSYVVALENLGELPALIAASGLLIDYMLKEIGPFAYNLGVKHADDFFRKRMEGRQVVDNNLC